MRKLGVLFVVLCGSMLLTGCGGGSESASNHPPSYDAGVPATTPGFRTQQAPNSEQAPAQDTSAVTERKEVVTGSVNLTAGNPIAAAQTLADRVRALDGRVDQRTENPGTDDNEPKANLIVRIPATETEAFITDLGDLGEVTEISTNRDDVTMRWQDLDARITALDASVDRLRDLMARAADTADLLAAEEALAVRQGELDSLTGQRRYLDDQISLSTLTIDITSVAEVTGDTGPANFWDGVVDGWNSLIGWLKDAVVFVGQALPWLVFVAVVGGIIGAITGIVRRMKARGAEAGSGPVEAAAGRTESGAVRGEADGETVTSPAVQPGKTSASTGDDRSEARVGDDQPDAQAGEDKPDLRAGEDKPDARAAGDTSDGAPGGDEPGAPAGG